MGSLVTALASYLDVKSKQGQWLVRMENLDPPREMPGAEKLLLSALEAHGLEWDGEVLFQSERASIYTEYLEACFKQGKAFYCVCSRQDLLPYKGVYPGTCRHQLSPPLGREYAVRIKLENQHTYMLMDNYQGRYEQDLAARVGDFVIKRKDGFFAYHFAVVIDDALQGVNRVIRGVDLLDSSLQQIYLQEQLGLDTPSYGHILLVMNDFGQKLSKRAHAPALDLQRSNHNLYDALCFLQQNPPSELRNCSNAEVISWALENWIDESLKGKREVLASSLSRD